MTSESLKKAQKKYRASRSQLRIDISKEEHQFIRDNAQERNMSIKELVMNAVGEYVGKGS